MKYAEIIGWGKCAPPATLSNDDLASFMDTNDDWIVSRTGIKQRHISHVSCAELAKVAAKKAIACAGIESEELDLVILGSNTANQMVPNTASAIVNAIGATNASGFDVNSACTSFLYALNIASDMIKAGSVQTVLVIGMDKVSRFLDWGRRESAVLFGDGGGAVVLKATNEKLGLLSANLSIVPDTQDMIELPGFGMDLPLEKLRSYYYSLGFKGQDIFKNAVRGMHQDCTKVMIETGILKENIDFFIPHQANVRIIEALAKRMDFEMDKVMVTVHKYGNTSSGTIPLSLCDALDEGRIKPGMTILTTSFGAGLTCGAGIIKWGDRVTAINESNAELPASNLTGLQIIQPAIEAAKVHYKKEVIES